MSTSLYEIGGDYGNWGAKVVRDGLSVVIRNVAYRTNGSDDAIRNLDAFAGHFNGAHQNGTESARFIFGNQEWIVGEAAYEHNLKAQSETSYSRYGTDEWYALIAASFVKLYSKRSGTVALTFSMPVSQFRAGRKDEIKDMLVGEWNVEIDGKRLSYEVMPEMLEMVPEGFGSLAYLTIADNCKKFADRTLTTNRIALFDFGGFTLDILTFEEFRPAAYNESLTSGLLDVRSKVNRELKRRYNRGDVPDKILDEVIRTGQYKHSGFTPESVKDIVDDALVELMKDALRVWQQDLGSGADIDTVIISGGGGPILGPALMPQLRHGDVRIIPEGEAHLANATGALRFRKFRRAMAQPAG